jgi:hypothetical protein
LSQSFPSVGYVRSFVELYIIEKGVDVMKSCPQSFEPRVRAFSELEAAAVNACWLTPRALDAGESARFQAFSTPQPFSHWTACRRPPQRK